MSLLFYRQRRLFFFLFNDTATTEIYTLSLHDALPIWLRSSRRSGKRHGTSRNRARVICRVAYTVQSTEPRGADRTSSVTSKRRSRRLSIASIRNSTRSEEHTSELQSLAYLVCRLLLEK